MTGRSSNVPAEPPSYAVEGYRVPSWMVPDLGVLDPVSWRAHQLRPDGGIDEWVLLRFSPEIWPVLEKARQLAVKGHVRALLELDRMSFSRWSARSSQASRRAGRRLLANGVPVGDRVLQRLALAAAAGEIPVHMATVVAARCAAFSLSPLETGLVYIQAEMRLGAPEWSPDRIARCLDRLHPWMTPPGLPQSLVGLARRRGHV